MPRTTRGMLDTPVTESRSSGSTRKKHAAGPSSSTSSAVPMSASKAKAQEHLGRVVSTQALPTPPATRKRKRARSRVTDSDTEEDEELPVLEPSAKESRRSVPGPVEEVKEDAVVIGNKKRRTLKLDAIAEELSQKAAEDAFWTADSRASILPIIPKNARTRTLLDSVATRQEERGRSRSRDRTRSPSSSPPAPHLLKRKRTGLFSPPPSRRDSKPVSRPVTPPPLPRTPQRKNKSRKGVGKRLFPERDSPNNPFLAADSPSVPGSSSISPERQATPDRYVEKPTITMVYRGVKHEFINPLYDPDAPNGIPSDSNSPSKLPPTDPDFSPTPYCPPKLLFPEARKLDHAKIRTRASGSPSPNPSLVEEADDEGGEWPSTPKPKHVQKSRPVGLTATLAGVAENMKTKAKGKGKEKKSEWDSSDEEDDHEGLDEPPVQLLRRSPRLNGRIQAAAAAAAPVSVRTGRVPRVEGSQVQVERERGRPIVKKDVKEAARLAPLLFGGRD